MNMRNSIVVSRQSKNSFIYSPLQRVKTLRWFQDYVEYFMKNILEDFAKNTDEHLNTKSKQLSHMDLPFFFSSFAIFLSIAFSMILSIR